jgi:hypothetical protein
MVKKLFDFKPFHWNEMEERGAVGTPRSVPPFLLGGYGGRKWQ